MVQSTVFIFDMDGTIVDNMGVHTRVWIDILGELGVHLTVGEFHRQASGKTTRQILRQLVGDRLSDEEMEEYSKHKESLYRSTYRPHIRPVNGLIEFLEETRRLGIRLALATSAGKENIDFVLNSIGIVSYFSAVVGAEEVEHGKPDPEMFQAAAQKLGVEPEQCLVFEDSLVGVDAASRAGMKVIVITTTVDSQEFQGLEAVVRIIDDFTSLDPKLLIEMV
jgi:beta-phosphoglucomutase family hydrolase